MYHNIFAIRKGHGLDNSFYLDSLIQYNDEKTNFARIGNDLEILNIRARLNDMTVHHIKTDEKLSADFILELIKSAGTSSTAKKALEDSKIN